MASVIAGLARARLLLDIVSVKLLVWALGENGELLDSHLFFFDRYSRLADHHRSAGQPLRAERLDAMAAAHYRAAPDDDDPPAAAIAMPIRRRRFNTNAVSTTRIETARPGGPSGLTASPTL